MPLRAAKCVWCSRRLYLFLLCPAADALEYLSIAESPLFVTDTNKYACSQFESTDNEKTLQSYAQNIRLWAKWKAFFKY